MPHLLIMRGNLNNYLRILNCLNYIKCNVYVRFKYDAETVRVVTVNELVQHCSTLCKVFSPVRSCQIWTNEGQCLSFYATHIFPEDFNVTSHWRHDVVCCMKNTIYRIDLTCLTILPSIVCFITDMYVACIVYLYLYFIKKKRRRRSLNNMTYEFRGHRHAPILPHGGLECCFLFENDRKRKSSALFMYPYGLSVHARVAL